MSKECTRLLSVIPGWMTGQGIFSALSSYPVPWADDIQALLLDLEYVGNVSGDKIISPLVSKLLGDTETLTDEQIGQLAGIVWGINGKRWEKLYVTLSLEYNPIENYSMTETMTDDKTVTEYGRTDTRTDDLQHGVNVSRETEYGRTDTRTDDIQHGLNATRETAYGKTDTRTDDLTRATNGSTSTEYGRTDTETKNLHGSRTPNLTDTAQHDINGFNSDSAVPADTDTTTHTGTETEDHTGTDTVQHTGTDTETRGETEKDTGTQTNAQSGKDTVTDTETRTDTGTETTAQSGKDTVTETETRTDTGTSANAQGGSDTRTHGYNLTRSGNIGVTTSQQMIESERELWMWSFFRDVVFPDVDKTLCIAIY